MHYRQLGRSGLLVSSLCLGTMIFGEESERGTPSADAERIISRFLDAGGNFLDTADVYAGGHSEEVVGRAIRGKRDEVVVASKVRFSPGTGPNDGGLSRQYILRALDASLRRLQTDYIDVYYVHAWDALTPLEETLRALDDMLRAGKVRYIGVSNFKAWQVMKALALSDAYGWARFVAAQLQYSLVNREIEDEFSDLCPSEGIGITAWGPLGGGFLSGKYRRDRRPQAADEGRIATTGSGTEEAWERRNTQRNWDVLETAREIAQAHEATVAQIALAWLRAQPIVSSVILGIRTLPQLEENLPAAELELSAQERGRLDHVSAPPERYPYRLIEAERRRV
jgi:aryl-alcohol dehydrogenase-like predicted oxidoreductase